MRTKVVRLAALASAMFTLTSCSSMVSPDEQLASARSLWAQRAPASYSITLRRGCECLPESTGPATVTVSNGAISVHYTSTGAAVPKAYAAVFPDVEGLFDLIETAQKNNYYKVDVEYDSELGYPKLISIDINKQMIDDEFGIYVQEFKSY